MSEALTKEEFVAEMKAAREAETKEEARKAKQHEYARKSYEKKKAMKAAKETEETLAVITEGSCMLTAEEGRMLSQYIRDTMCHAIEMDRYFTEEMIFDLVHLADRLGGAK